MPKRGLALIVVVGVLGILAVLAAAFVVMAQLERRASEQRVNAARAYLLGRSGVEDALARLALAQDPVYGGEDWNGNGAPAPDPGVEQDAQVHQPTVSNRDDCPLRHALAPSFPVLSAAAPALVPVDGKLRGLSGRLSADAYVLKVRSLSGAIFINGGALDDQDRDPDGPGALPASFPLNPGAADEVAPLKPNGVPDHRDVSLEGPNGFLVRLLNNLDAVVTEGAAATLGSDIVAGRPLGGLSASG